MAKPSVRVAVSEQCNLRCDYCPIAGDSVEMQSTRLGLDDFKALLSAAIDVGFQDFSFTGGEPLLTDSSAETTFELARFVNGRRPQVPGYTKLNTNGANVLRYFDGIVETGFDELKISLDTLRAEVFRRIAHRNESVFENTIEGILKIKDKVPIRLQTVVGKYNEDEVSAIIDFCVQNSLDIKLFDLSSYDNALSGSRNFADNNYVRLDKIALALEDDYGPPSIKYAVGGVGHAKKVFTTPKGTKIELRDTSVAAHYSKELCGGCPKYPCQDGLCNIVIAADGHIQFCREGGTTQTISLRDGCGKLYGRDKLVEGLAIAGKIFSSSQYIQRTIAPRRTE